MLTVLLACGSKSSSVLAEVLKLLPAGGAGLALCGAFARLYTLPSQHRNHLHGIKMPMGRLEHWDPYAK